MTCSRQTVKIITCTWIIVKTVTITDYAADKCGNFSVTIVMQADRQTVKIITCTWIIIKTITTTEHAADISGNFSVTIVSKT